RAADRCCPGCTGARPGSASATDVPSAVHRLDELQLQVERVEPSLVARRLRLSPPPPPVSRAEQVPDATRQRVRVGDAAQVDHAHVSLLRGIPRSGHCYFLFDFPPGFLLFAAAPEPARRALRGVDLSATAPFP